MYILSIKIMMIIVTVTENIALNESILILHSSPRICIPTVELIFDSDDFHGPDNDIPTAANHLDVGTLFYFL